MKVLVVGGTGPTGPGIVNGLLERGHDLTILHTGAHEVDFLGPVRHIHADPHVAASLSDSLSHETFDLSVGMYGRLAHVVEALAGKTSRFIGIGAMYYEGWVDNVMHGERVQSDRQDAKYVPLTVPVPEHTPRRALDGDRFTAKGIAAEDRITELHESGVWEAVFLRYPAIYGPRQHAPGLWPLMLRILDGRPILVPDAGLLMQTRCYTESAVDHVLAAVDRFSAARGRAFNVSDRSCLSLRDWIGGIAEAMERQARLVSVPLSAASATFDYSKGPFTMGHKVADTCAARTVLGLTDLPDPLTTLRSTVLWHLADVPPPHELDRVRSRWDIATEDALVDAVEHFEEGLGAIRGASFRFRHTYLHPEEPGG